MFTKAVLVTYRDKTYDMSIIKNVALSPIVPLDSILDQIQYNNDHSPCKVIIAHIECVIEPGHNEFGSRYGGHWECTFGHIDNIYPIPLKRMVEGTGFVRYRDDNRYKLVAENGYPWRCPVCRAPLVYKEDHTGY